MASHRRDSAGSSGGTTPSGSLPDGLVVLERLPQRRRRPATFAILAVSLVGLLMWAPWRGGGADVPASSAAIQPQPSEPALGQLSSSEPTARLGPSTPPEARYESITDNEWTVVALLTPSDGGSTEEPANQHENWPGTSSDGPFVVLQQGVVAGLRPIDRPDRPASACATSGSRDQTAVHLPRGRVVYLGVTFPGMDPQADVAVSALTVSPTHLTRPASVAVELAGMRAGWRYTVPTTGPGGTILFVTSPAGLWASGPYRFEIRTPASDAPRFVYACVGL